MPWEVWDERVYRSKPPDEAARILRRTPEEVRRRAVTLMCGGCPKWERGRCGIEKDGLEANELPTRNMTRYPMVHVCHLGLD